jgi:signal transduction histidine kinase
LEIEVADDGVAPTKLTHDEAMTTDGNGLRGIAERVGALGGIVSTGPRDGGGFSVHAVLPTGVPLELPA